MRAVLGGQPGEAGDEVGDLLAVTLPGVVDGLRAGQVVQHAGLDGVDELPRLTFPGDQVVAPAGDELALSGELQEGQSDRIVLLKTGEEPAVGAGFGQGGLDGGNPLSQHGTSVERRGMVSEQAYNPSGAPFL